MAISSAGYAGTVNEIQWAAMSRYFGLDYGVKTRADLACTQVAATKTFSIAAGEFYGRGVADVSDSPVTISPAVPASGGRWFLIVARRVWATKTTSLLAVAGATTTVTPPTVPPTVLPGINSNPGVIDDQPLFWVWVNASNTTTFIWDLRGLPLAQRVGNEGWVDYVPVITGMSSTLRWARYALSVSHLEIDAAGNYTGGMSNPYVGLPPGFSAIGAFSDIPVGLVSLFDVSAGAAGRFAGLPYLTDAAMRIMSPQPSTGVSAPLTTSYPFTWANGDRWELQARIPLRGLGL